MAQDGAPPSSAAPPWHAAFPPPSEKEVDGVSAAVLLQMMRRGQVAGRDFLLVDLRRNDHEGGTIRGSLNLPAQSLYYSLPTLFTTCRAAGISTVIFYCGSSRGRGTRAAAWFQDYHLAQNDTKMASLVLFGGIKGWAAAGAEYTELMDGYDPDVWSRSSNE